MMVYVGVLVSVALTGMKPEKMPATLLLVWAMGVQGLAKLDCVTVWFPAANWNCTMSPTLAFTSLGENVREPLVLPTLTTWTLVMAVDAAAGGC